MKKMIFVVVMMSVYAMGKDFKMACTPVEFFEMTQADKNVSIPVGGSRDNFYLIYPKSVYLREKNILQAWVVSAQSVNERKKKIKEDGKRYRNYGFEKSLFLFNIDKEISTIISTIEYSCDGSVVGGTTTKYDSGLFSEWDNITPNSVDEAIYQNAMEIIQTQPTNHKDNEEEGLTGLLGGSWQVERE